MPGSERLVAPRTSGGRELGVVVGLTLALVAPLLVGLVALRNPTWFPTLDLAMTELRVRDVGTTDTPLIGLPGRIGPTLAEQGSHPGPLSFYFVAPGYRLFGATSWALHVGSVFVHAVAIGVALMLARRRGGLVLVAAMAVLLAVLTRAYGVTLLTQPWNPYLPVLWWVVLLLAAWSVLDGDLAALPVAVFAASFCAQTHVPYVPLAGGLGAFAAAAAGWAILRAPRGSPLRRTGWRWLAVAAVFGVVLWLPPLLDQLRNDPGNLVRLAKHFSSPPERAVGLRTGVALALRHFDLAPFGLQGRLAVATVGPLGPVAPGLVFLAVWAAAVAVTWRIGHATLLRLHGLLAVAVALGTLSLSRIFGDLWYYLMLWAWGTTCFIVVAIGWTVASAVGARRQAARAVAAPIAAPVAVLVAVTVAVSVLFAVESTDALPPEPRLSNGLAALLPDTVAALERGTGGATGKKGVYVVRSSDAVHISAQAYGLVSELERRGYVAGMLEELQAPVTPHRVLAPDEATRMLQFATGQNIDVWRGVPAAIEIASVDPRTPAEVAEFERLRTRTQADLRSVGLDDVANLVDTDLFSAANDPRIERPTRRRIARMVVLGLPLAVFIAPTDAMP